MIPISILTGFLGSGKTTILAHLLHNPALSDTAVIINEFGDIGLDHDLIETSDETLVTLTTGCLCCKMQGDLITTLLDLFERRNAGTIPPFARVVVETSGLSDPAPILQGLMIDEGAAQHFSLARVLTIVDAVNGLATLKAHPEARKQVAVADHLVISKTDLIDGDDGQLHEKLGNLNPSVHPTLVSHGRLDPGVLFPNDTTPPSIAADPLSTENNLPPQGNTEGYAEGHPHVHSHTHDETDHDTNPIPHDDIVTFAIVRERPVPAVALSLFLEALADHCGSDLLRLKGLVRIAEHAAQPAVIHGVQHVFHAPVWLDHWPSDDHRSRIVFIVRGISKAWVLALLETIELEVKEMITQSSFAIGEPKAQRNTA